MAYLKQETFRVIALKDIEPYLPPQAPQDPTLRLRHPLPKDGKLTLPAEVEATQADLPYWTSNMAEHGYSREEMARVAGTAAGPVTTPAATGLRVRPYPGGRHPRVGFLDGAIAPQRGTKATVFLPWDPASHVVVDVPEAIFSNLGLLYLAHTHIPTIWDAQNIWIENVDWTRETTGALRSRWELPNGVSFGASVAAEAGEVRMELWLRNGTPQPLTGLRTQVCVMLKGAPEFNRQTAENKVLGTSVAEVRSESRSIRTEWERCGRTWGNPQVPCLHSDPVLPECPAGKTVRVKGRLWFEDRTTR
jgi:hypothetical protein